jgi:cation transport ATPase
MGQRPPWRFINGMEGETVESPQRGAGFLREFREFLAFLSTLWGLLGGISVFFPFSNLFSQVIPLEAYGVDDGVFNILSPPFITLVVMVVTLFVVLSTFGRRDAFKELGGHNARPQAWISMGISMTALLAYMTIHRIYGEYAYSVFKMGSDDPRKLFFEAPLLLAYTAFFSLLTRAFMLLAMLEFYRED